MKVANDHSEPVEISAVIPVLNEKENLPILIPHLEKVLKNVGLAFEMIFVDDGSTDGSKEMLQRMASQFPSLRAIVFKENRGLSTALYAGMKEARGHIIVTLDSDLQNDPDDIPKLLEYLGSYDMATGWRKNRQDPWLKKISSWVANSIRDHLTGEHIQDSACTLRAFKKECVENIPAFNGMHRFLSTLAMMEGYRIIEVPVSHHARRFGKSKYNIRNRMWRSFIDLMAVRWMKHRRIDYVIEERI